MPNEQRFTSSIFGGFKKKSVIEYINHIIIEHEKEIKKLKETKDASNEELQKSLEEERALCNRYKDKILKLEHNVDEYNENVDNVMKEKDQLLKLQEQHAFQLEEKIKDLEKELEKFKEEQVSQENKIKRAEYIAREKVNQIIKKGKTKITNEYNEKVQKWEEEKENLKQEALKEVARILNNAAVRVSSFNGKAQKEIEIILKEAEKKAQKIVCSARILADEILRKSAKIASDQSSSFDLSQDRICSKFDVRVLNEDAKQDVKDALEKLKNLNLFESVDDVFNELRLKDNNMNRVKKNKFGSFRRKNRE